MGSSGRTSCASRWEHRRDAGARVATYQDEEKTENGRERQHRAVAHTRAMTGPTPLRAPPVGVRPPRRHTATYHLKQVCQAVGEDVEHPVGLEVPPKRVLAVWLPSGARDHHPRVC